jgi:membrane-bound lytic murein transglycosylase B
MIARVLFLAAAILAAPAIAHAASFSDFLHAFRATAIASGVSPDVYDLSTAGLTPDPTIKNLVETQPEFTTPI